MNLGTFTSFILLLCLGWMQLYSKVRDEFNPARDLKHQIVKKQEQIERERLAWSLEKDQFLAFREEVAVLLPEAVERRGQGLSGYPIRGLASQMTRTQSDQVRSLVAKSLFESGKRHFLKKDYEKSERALKQVIEKFGYTTYVTDAYFLLSEVYFHQTHLEEATETIRQMVELFPTHELTGFALIRLGKIYEMQRRKDEAVDIYKTVMRSFPQRDVAGQAKASLKGVKL